MARYPGFVGPSYTTQSKIAADDRTVNWIPAKIESGTGTTPYVFDPAPGFRAYCTLTNGPGRGFFTLNGATFAVADEDMVAVPFSIGGTPIIRATGISNLGNGLVSMAGNGDGGHQIMIASDGQLYVFNVLTNVLTPITSGPSGTAVAFQDGYFLALDPNTSNLYLSALEDGTSWDPLDVLQRSDSADKWQAMLARQAPKEIWLFGSQSTSVLYDANAPDFAFVENPNVALSYGTAAPASPQLLQGSPIWLANDLTVRYANGYTAARVSTHAVEYAIAQYAAAGTIANADGFVYVEQGHSCYVLTFPGIATWVFDVSSGLWHERGSWDGLTFTGLPVWTSTFVPNANATIVADRTSGAVYQMTQDVSTDTDGTGLVRVRRAPHLVEGLNRVIYDSFLLYMEVGLGLATGQGSDPLAMLRYSDDGGQTWSPSINASVGRIGDYRRRVLWRKLGHARDRVFEVSVSDPIPWRLVDAYLDLRAGAS